MTRYGTVVGEEEEEVCVGGGIQNVLPPSLQTVGNINDNCVLDRLHVLPLVGSRQHLEAPPLLLKHHCDGSIVCVFPRAFLG